MLILDQAAFELIQMLIFPVLVQTHKQLICSLLAFLSAGHG